jgi:hypothetical protein
VKQETLRHPRFRAAFVAALTWESRKRASKAAVFCALLALAVPSLALDRNTFSFPITELQVTLDPSQQALAVEGTLELRNISGKPQAEAALQISSSLRWLSVLANGEPVEWLAQSYSSDIDHTGLLSEAIVKFAHPLAPGETLQLEVRYSGTVPRDATRLERIGTPREIAERSDWDEISDNFTALRGAGFVTWYPVAMEAASLSQGNEVFETLRDWRERQSAARLRIHLARAVAAEADPSQFTLLGNGSGDVQAVSSAATSSAAASANLPANTATKHEAVLTQEFRGVEPVLVLLADAASTTDRPGVAAYYTAAHTSLARDAMAAVEAVIPPLSEWFGSPKSKVVLVELADPEALPYNAGAFYFAPLHRLARETAEVAMARPVVSAMIASPRPWVDEGLAGFAQALIRERQAGRSAALAYLGRFGPALASAEEQSHAPAKPEVGSTASNSGSGSASASTSNSAASSASAAPAPGLQPLAVTADEIFLRTKAAYVWWMLRDMAGDRALQKALASYRAAADHDTGYVQRLIEAQLSPPRSLETFFDEWVYRDRGLPQLRVVSAYTRKTLGEQTVTAVTVENLGEAGCEVPVMVRSATTEGRVRLLVPARSKAIVRVPLDATPSEAEVNDGSVPEALSDKTSRDNASSGNASRGSHVLPVTTSPAFAP